MPRRSHLLTVDGVANLLFGIAVLACPEPFFRTLGLPWPGHSLYSTILGGVLVGIGLALIREGHSKAGVTAGLGLWGAVAINLSAGLVIAGWLLFSGNESVLAPGRMVLWALVLFLIGLSVAEIVAQQRGKNTAAS